MKKWVKRMLYFLSGIILLLLIFILLLQTSWAKNLIREKLQAYISTKTKTEFSIASIDYSLPKWIELNGVFMRDQSKDTLLYGGKIKVDIAMLQLIGGKYDVDKIVLDNVYINLVRKEKDSTFNYQFIIDAFAGKTDTPKKDTASTFHLTLNEVLLHHVRFNQLDYYGGSFTRIVATDFQLKMESLDLNKMNFAIKRLYADNIDFSTEILKQQPITKSTGQQNHLPIIRIDSLIVKQSNILFDDRPAQLYTKDRIGLLQLAKLSNTANKNTFIGKSFVLAQSDIQFQNAIKQQSVTVKNDTLTATLSDGSSMNFIVDEIDLLQNNIAYDNTEQPAKKTGIDYFHLGIKDLNLVASSTKYIDGNIQANIQSFSFKDKSGFSLESMSGNVNVTKDFVSLKNFILRTLNSSINVQAVVYPTSLEEPIKPNEKLPENDISINKTIIGKKDLDLLADGLTEQYKKQIDDLGNLLVDAHVKGNANKLFIQQLNISSTTPNTLNVQMTGIVQHATDKKNIKYNVNFKNISASQKILAPFVNTSTQKINLPPILNINGTMAGDMRNVTANLTTNSAYGFAAIKARLIQFDQPSKMTYDIAVNANNLETGKWIGQDSLLGKLTGAIAVKGSNGFDVKNNNMQVLAAIKSFRLKEKIVSNIKVNSSLNNGLINGSASINDPLIAININGKANIHNEYPTVDAIVNIGHADLYALGFSTDTMNVTAIAKIKIDDATPKNLHAAFRIDSAIITKDEQKISIDSATVLAFVRNDSTIIQVVSPFADANMKSTVYYNEIPLLLQEVMSRFIPSNTIAGNKTNKKPAQQGTIQANFIIKPNDTYSAFVDNLSFADPITVNANITNKSQDSAVNVVMNVPGLQVNNLRVGKMHGNVIGKGDSLNVNIGIDTLKEGNIVLYDAIVKGGFSKNNMAASFASKDGDKKDQFRISAIAKENKVSGYDISLQNDLMLSSQIWTVNKENLFRTSAQGFNIQNFDINNGAQKIAIHNESQATTSPIIVDIDNFKLSSISSAINKDSLQVEGLLNVNMKVSDLKNAIPTMEGTVKLDSLVYQNMSVGNLDLKAQSANGNVTVSGKFLGNNNNVGISGNYTANNIDVKINLNPVSLASIQPFTSGNLTRSSGSIYGPINITGAANDPKWSGELRFDKVQTTVKQFGTILKIDNQKISFNYPTIQFNNFTIVDSTNNTVKIDGTISQNEDKDFISDLSVKANDFHALNNSAVDNNILYGNAIVDIDVEVKGDVTAPDISGDISIKKGTQVTFVRQNVAPSAKDREGVIEFIDMDTVTNLLTKKTYQDALAIQQKKSSASSFNYDLNLDIDKDAKFDVVVDPITGDQLEVQGSGQITAGLNPNGSVALTGTYNLNKGYYQLNYQFIKRKFVLLDSSSITLSGDPDNAAVNITAAYEINASAFDLVGNEISGTTSSENDVYKRKIPFQVLLKIKGEISKPELGFDIVVKENADGVSYEMANTIDNKLQQLRADPSAMNKQVFALLILNRFIGEQSRDFFAGTDNSSAGLLGNASVSAFLSDAINQIASDLIKGVDIDLNLKNVDDDPSSPHTDLTAAVSKSFLNDRLSVSVGKSFTVEGDDPSARGRNGDNDNVQFIPDVNTTYKLSKDGKYILRAYRKNAYEELLDGYFIETGVAFKFTMDYNKFCEIIKKKKKG